MKTLIIIALHAFMCVVCVALAGTTVTVKNGPTVMNPAPPGVKRNLYDTDTDAVAGESTHQRCVRITGALPGHSTCTDVFDITVTQTCADEKAPRIQLVKNADGGFDQPDAAVFPVAGNDTKWDTKQWLFIHNLAWPNGYPNCWVRGWENPDLWRLNPKVDAPNVFMERIEPGMVDDVDLPNDESYTCWPDEAECVPPVTPS